MRYFEVPIAELIALRIHGSIDDVGGGGRALRAEEFAPGNQKRSDRTHEAASLAASRSTMPFDKITSRWLSVKQAQVKSLHTNMTCLWTRDVLVRCARMSFRA